MAFQWLHLHGAYAFLCSCHFADTCRLLSWWKIPLSHFPATIGPQIQSRSPRYGSKEALGGPEQGQAGLQPHVPRQASGEESLARKGVGSEGQEERSPPHRPLQHKARVLGAQSRPASHVHPRLVLPALWRQLPCYCSLGLPKTLLQPRHLEPETQSHHLSLLSCTPARD